MAIQTSKHSIAMPATPKKSLPYPMIPGPGAYDVNTNARGGGFLGEGPQYTLRSRAAMPRSAAQSPGPVYSPRSLTPRSDRPMGEYGSGAPAYTMGVTRRIEEGKGAAPGPGTYSARHNQHGTGISLGDAPSFGFGTSAQRPPTHQARGARYVSEEMAKRSTFGLHSPGPMMYSPRDNNGHTSPRYSFRPRLPNYNTAGAEADSQHKPGPGTYAHAGSFGRQTLSAFRSGGSFGMGTSTRPQPDQPGKALYLGKGLDKSNFGIHSPGPMVYGAKSTIGASVNTNSKYGNASAFSFGSEDRFAY